MSDLTNGGLIIIGFALAVVAAVAMALRRRQERSILETWASRQGWTLNIEAEEELQEGLRSLALLQIGHSRRFTAVAEDAQGVRVFEYACETGFEHERASHRWIGVLIPLEHRRTRATITDESWVLAAAANPAYGELPIGPKASKEGANGQRIAILEDVETWKADLEGEIGRRIAMGPRGRTWEIGQGMVTAYQAVPLTEEEVESLLSAGKEIAKMI